MTCTQALLSLLLISPCTDGGGQTTDFELAIADPLAHPQRIEDYRTRDTLLRTGQVLAFFEIKPGMPVLDLFSGGGYYSDLLSRITGPSGNVVSHTNLAYIDDAESEIGE